MERVTLRLPGVLATLVEGRRELTLEAGTVHGALRALVEELPVLEVHLFDEKGGLRRHVLCFHNGRNTRWDEGSLDAPLAAGDEILIMQAVSGG